MVAGGAALGAESLKPPVWKVDAGPDRLLELGSSLRKHVEEVRALEARMYVPDVLLSYGDSLQSVDDLKKAEAAYNEALDIGRQLPLFSQVAHGRIEGIARAG